MATRKGSDLSPVPVAGGTDFAGGIIPRSPAAQRRTVIVPSRSAEPNSR